MSVTLPIYLDNAATTKPDPRVVEKMLPYLTDIYGNPASTSHQFGWKASEAVENARAEVARLIGADPKEIVFTSGATESDNLAVKGAAHFYQTKGKHLITVKTEHKAILDSMRQLEREGFEVTYLGVGEDGLISLDELQAAIRPDTTVVSVMWANNEIGVIQPIKEIGSICRERKIVFHCDATQAAGKTPIDVNDACVDLMSLSGHKIYGPKGVGALYVRRKPRIRLETQMHGGGHERGFRSGTLPTHQIVGMGEAFRLARLELEQDAKHCLELREAFLDGIKDIPEHFINGSMEHRLPSNLNVSFACVEGESLMMALKDLALSSGSACTSASLEPSYVLRALGRTDDLAHSSLRITYGRFNTVEEMRYAARRLTESVAKLRDLSPLWEMRGQGVDLEKVSWSAQ